MKTPFGTNMIKVVKLTNILFPGNDLINQSATLPQEQTREQAFFAYYNGLNQIPLEQRITDLFIHIDSLGNYSNREWLTGLNHDRLYYLVLKINQLWHRIPNSSRMRICPYISPFSPHIFEPMPTQITIEMVVRMATVLTYSGIDNDNKQLGAMYFLSGLTLFSQNARNQMPWLYWAIPIALFL